MEKVKQQGVDPGYQTPSKAFGSGLILEIPGVKREVLQEDGLWKEG